MKTPYKIVDVFENGACTGNPVCVVKIEGAMPEDKKTSGFG